MANPTTGYTITTTEGFFPAYDPSTPFVKNVLPGSFTFPAQGVFITTPVLPEAYVTPITTKHYVTKAQVHALRSLQDMLHGSAVEAGWHDTVRDFGTGIALIHSEVSEALEGYRKGLNDDHLPSRPMAEVEFADAIIRILDEAGLRGYDVAGALAEKFNYNQTRADHKRENRAKEGGKKF